MEIDNQESSSYKRNIDDVQAIIKHAKLDEKNLTQITQAIYYPDSISESNDLRLLELDDHLLETINEGDTIVFKGGLNEKVVLCTDTKTYEIKEAEISNSLILIPDFKFGQATSISPLKSPKGNVNNSLENSISDSDDEKELPERIIERCDAIKIFHEYLECREINPRFRKLGDLLQLTKYSGPENEYRIDEKFLFTFDQLLDTVQSSRKQFFIGLKKFRAIEIDGYIRMLEPKYEYRIINLMLELINENSWNLDRIDRQTTIDALEGIAPKDIVSGLFDIYTKPSENNQKFTYIEEMVAKIIAQNILQPGLKFREDEFLSTWQEALPNGMSINEEYLHGLGIIDRESSTPCVRSLLEDNLSTDIHERLRVLFKTKTTWTLNQIQPYIEYFSTPTCPVTTILAKYARSMTQNGQRLYVAKHT